MNRRISWFSAFATSTIMLAAACSSGDGTNFTDDDVSTTGSGGDNSGGSASNGSANGGSTTANGGNASSGGNGSGGNGSGGDAGCTDPSDCGEDTDCVTQTCDAGVCGSANVDSGEACDEGDGNVCDGEGACVECLDNDQCLETEYCDTDANTCKDLGGNTDDCTDGNECASGICINALCCGDDVDEDADQDGFTAAEGDCNDCDPNTNPNAVDIINLDGNGDPLPDNSQVDENCDGTPLLPIDAKSCDDDAALVLDASDAKYAAMAMDLCQEEAVDGFGLVSAEWVQMDGTALPATTQADLGHGIIDGLGANVTVQNGTKMLLLSNGVARRPGDADYADDLDKAYQCAYPSGVPFTSAACPNATTGMPQDSIALRVNLKAPTNAEGFSFQVKFYSDEFPDFVCGNFNDLFLAAMSPPPAGAAPIDTGNVTFDANGEPLTINNALFDVCEGCTAGTDELLDTGFETHGGTTWLTTSVPIEGGDEFQIDFGIMDAGDGILKSSVVLDNFDWDAKPGQIITQ